MYTLSTSGIATAELSVIGYPAADVQTATLPVDPDAVGTFRVFVTAPRGHLTGKATDFQFVLTDQASGAVIEHPATFSGPENGR